MNQIEPENDSEIERKVLGNILRDPEALLPFMNFLLAKDFSRREHRTIYETMLSLTRQGEPFDFITVVEELEKHKKLEQVGGVTYIDALVRQILPSDALFPSEILYPADDMENLVRLTPQVNEGLRESIIRYNRAEIVHPHELQRQLTYFSPSFQLLDQILEEKGAPLDRLHWRDFEELIADLLIKDGFQVELGPGTKDGGKDIIAMKELEGHGWFMSVWQAKKLKPGKKVELSVIRELADTRQKVSASKGIIVTSTYLTRGALNRVTEDRFLLGKIDRDDLLGWIQRVRRKY